MRIKQHCCKVYTAKSHAEPNAAAWTRNGGVEMARNVMQSRGAGIDGYRGGRGSGGGASRGVGELDGGPRELVAVVVIVAPAAAVPARGAHDPREALRGGARVLRPGAGAGARADPRAAACGGGGPGAAEGSRPRVAVNWGQLLRGSAGRRLRAAAGLVMLRVEAPPRRVPQPAAARARRPRQAIHGSVTGIDSVGEEEEEEEGER